MIAARRIASLAPLLGALCLLGCPDEKSSATGTATTAGATATAVASASGSASAAPTASASTPKPYQGPTGTIKGVVEIEGDDPPRTPFSYPEECEGAAGTYGKLFRVGQDGQLADAIVAVTHYDGFVPPKQEAVEITIKDCQYSQRSIAMTDNQYLSIRNLDASKSYIPHLDGARLPATLVAVPRGPEVKINSRGQGRYWLRDQMKRPFMVAHVFHFPYSTTDVTGLDGRFEIEGVPVGKAKLSAFLPQTKTMLSTSKEIEVKPGDNEVNLTLTFDAEKDTPEDEHGGSKPKYRVDEPGAPGSPIPKRNEPEPSAKPSAGTPL